MSAGRWLRSHPWTTCYVAAVVTATATAEIVRRVLL